MTNFNHSASRRQILIGAGALAGTSLLPAMIRSALAQDKGLAALLSNAKPTSLKPPAAVFMTNPGGSTGPWGEVRVGRAAANSPIALPALILSADKLGVVNFATRRPYASISGAKGDAIVLASEGVVFAKGQKAAPWNADTIKKLVQALAADRSKARALMQLRSALLTSYPVFLATSKAKTDPRLAKVIATAQGVMASQGCTTETVTDIVTTTVTDIVKKWKTAEEQYEKCFDRETSGDPDLGCSYLPAGPARDGCATIFCGAKGFVDVLVSVTEVVRTVTEEVVRTVVTCVINPAKDFYRNQWNLIETVLPGLQKTPDPKVGGKDLQAGLKFLQDAAGALGPFANCLLGAKWSIEGLGTPIPTGDGHLAIPYGVRVCMTATCASKLTVFGVGGELVGSWTAALTLLAALSVDFAAIAAGVGIVVPAALAAAVAALPPVAVTAAAIILAFIILALIYGTAIMAQLTIAEQLGAFNDGEVCIVHPTFALAMIKALTMGIAPSELVPPVVVG